MDCIRREATAARAGQSPFWKMGTEQAGRADRPSRVGGETLRDKAFAAQGVSSGGWDEDSGFAFLSSRPCCFSYSESAILEGGYRMENREPEKRICSVFKSGESTTSKAQFTQKWIELINRMELNKAATPAQQ